MQTSLQNNLFSDRLRLIMELKGYKNANEFATKGLGYPSSEKIARLFRDTETKPSYEILTDIANKFVDINMSYLVTGKGNPLVDLIAPTLAVKIAPETAALIADKMVPNLVPKVVPNLGLERQNMPKVVTVDSNKRDMVSLVPVKAAAGYLNGYGDPEYIERLPTLYLPGMDGATHRAFELKGQSMMPNLHSGSIQIGRWVEALKDIKDRRVYIILTKFDGIVIKRVLNRVKQDGKLIMISDNDNKKEYPNYPVDAEDVLEIWYWRGAIIREVPEPGAQYARFNDLEARLSLLESRYLSSK
jgi:hypothetical protein